MGKKPARRQHYVWRHYLSEWSTDNQIYCLFKKKDKIISCDNKNIAIKKDFYKVTPLKSKEIDLIEKIFIKPLTADRKVITYNYLKILKNINFISEDFEKTINIKDYDNKFKKFLIESEENYHNQIENGTIKFLEKLILNDFSFYENEINSYYFNFYLSLQYFRTLRIKENYLKIIKENKVEEKRLENIWNVIKFIFTINSTISLSNRSNDFNIFIVNNNTIIPFITGDQPIINTYGDYNSSRLLKDNEIEFYYPISLYKAIIISKDIPVLKNKHILPLDDKNVIKDYNKKILNASYSQVYAKNENDFLNV
jgi:hypothetical protein